MLNKGGLQNEMGSFFDPRSQEQNEGPPLPPLDSKMPEKVGFFLAFWGQNVTLGPPSPL